MKLKLFENLGNNRFRVAYENRDETDMSIPEEQLEVKIAKKIKDELKYARSSEQGGAADSTVRRSSALDNIEKLADQLLKMHGVV